MFIDKDWQPCPPSAHACAMTLQKYTQSQRNLVRLHTIFCPLIVFRNKKIVNFQLEISSIMI